MWCAVFIFTQPCRPISCCRCCYINHILISSGNKSGSIPVCVLQKKKQKMMRWLNLIKYKSTYTHYIHSTWQKTTLHGPYNVNVIAILYFFELFRYDTCAALLLQIDTYVIRSFCIKLWMNQGWNGRVHTSTCFFYTFL